MRLTIERGALLKALGHVQSVVERRNTIPILSNVLIEARDGSVTFAATDLDIEIVDGAEADVERQGAITVPAHLLYEIVRKLPDGSQVRLLAMLDNLGKGASGAAVQNLNIMAGLDETAGLRL